MTWLIRKIIRDKNGKVNLAKIVTVSVMGVLLFVGTLWIGFKVVAEIIAFNQTDWSGGADTENYATQTGWTKYYSKDSGIDTSTTAGQISLTNASGQIQDTLDADFNAGTLSQVAVSDDKVQLEVESTASLGDNWNALSFLINPSKISLDATNHKIYIADADGDREAEAVSRDRNGWAQPWASAPGRGAGTQDPADGRGLPCLRQGPCRRREEDHHQAPCAGQAQRRAQGMTHV